MKKATSYFAGIILGSMLFGGCSIGNQEASPVSTEVSEEKIASTEVVAEKMSDTEVKQEEKLQEEEPQIQTLTISATGDCTLGKMQDHGYTGSFDAYYDQYGVDYFFKDVKAVFGADDFTLINLECVLSDSTDRIEKTYSLKGKPEYTSIMTGSSVEGCTLGNNHSMDYGYQSLIDTEDALDKANIAYAYNEHEGLYTTESGLTVGFVSASLLSQGREVEGYLKDGIVRLQEQGADLIIACCHWGIEREYYPIEYQRAMAHELIDCGADLVIGNHPHVLQGMELYKNKMICYSLGNFCFGGNRNPADKNTLIYQQTFTYVDGELQQNIDARIIPCTLSSQGGYNDFQPTIVSGDKKQTIIDNVNTYSASYSNIKFDSNGKMTVSE